MCVLSCGVCVSYTCTTFNLLFYLLYVQLTNDVMLISYLATVTKGCNVVNEYVQKLNVLYDHHGILRRQRGSLF